MQKICKSFPGVLACDQVDLSVARGEILTLLGENGAGKTTLMNCLYGLYRPQSGRIFWKGGEVNITSPKVAIGLGIGMVHQHFMLIPPLSVVENVILGSRSPKSPLLDLENATEEVAQFSQKYGMQLDPKAPIWQLPVGVQQRVEIIKALYRKADLLILDEPTAVLTPSEVTDLFSVLSELTRKGLSIIFITHKLEEVMAVCDRVTVLRNGRVVGCVNKCDTTIPELTNMMVGRTVLSKVEKPPHTPGEVVLRVRDLQAKNDKGLLAIRNITFDIRQGEILGIAGVDGNGQKELVETLTGLRRASAGEVTFSGKDITNASPKKMVDLNIAHIPEDRQHTGLILDMQVAENLILKDFDQSPISKQGFFKQKSIRSFSTKIVDEFDIRTPGVYQTVRLLSGGNQQKLILGRELSRNPRLIVASQLTRGLDVGATEYVHKQIVAQKSNNTAILLVSTELDEILSLSDRIAVMYRGEILDILPASDADVQKIGLLMAGVGYHSGEPRAELQAQPGRPA